MSNHLLEMVSVVIFTHFILESGCIFPPTRNTGLQVTIKHQGTLFWTIDNAFIVKAWLCQTLKQSQQARCRVSQTRVKTQTEVHVQYVLYVQRIWQTQEFYLHIPHVLIRKCLILNKALLGTSKQIMLFIWPGLNCLFYYILYSIVYYLE